MTTGLICLVYTLLEPFAFSAMKATLVNVRPT